MAATTYKSMQSMTIQEQARFCVATYLRNEIKKETGKNPKRFEDSEIFIVWFCKTLQNWKALVGTTVMEDVYFEVTYNGDKNEVYLDVYEKLQNIVIPG